MENPLVHDYSNPQQGTSMAASPEQMQKSNERKSYTKLPPTHRDDRKIFVGGLPSNVTDEEFLAFFSQFGTVLDSIVMFDRETHRSRGFGFVTYEDPNVVRLLLEMKVEGTDGCGRVQMRGKVCEIKAAQPKESSYGGRGGGRRVNNKGYRSYPQQQGYGSPVGGQASYVTQGYASSPEVPTQVNQGVPSTLPMSNGHAAMYPPYGIGGGYYHHHAAPAAAYSPYMTGYAPEGAYYEQGYTNGAVPSAMAAAVPGPHSLKQTGDEAAYGYGNGFVPVGGDSTGEPLSTESPQGTSSGEEAK